MSRSRDGPATFLADYHGFLQADAFSGYDGIFLGSERDDRGSGLLGACAAEFLTTRGPMRRGRPIRSWSGSANFTTWQDRARDLPAEQRQALRQREVGADPRPARDVPGRAVAAGFLPKSALGKADDLLPRNQRAALRRYTGDGRLTIDNNVSERTLRLQAIGRKTGVPGE